MKNCTKRSLHCSLKKQALVVILPVEILAKEQSAHFWQHLLGQHVEPRLQCVADLDAVIADTQLHATTTGTARTTWLDTQVWELDLQHL